MHVRLDSGIVGFDEILHGGLPSEQVYLVAGKAGTGKSILSLQWALRGRDLGESVLVVTLAERASDLERHTAAFGWSLDGVTILDLSPTGEETEDGGEYAIFPPSEVERVQVWHAIREAVEKHAPRRIVIDSFTQLQFLSTDPYQFRKQLLGLVNFLKRSGATTLCPFEPAELAKDASVGLAVDGIVRLFHEVSPRRRIGLRSLHVEKLRGSDSMGGTHPLRIGADGVRVFPHRIEVAGETPHDDRVLGTGVDALDTLLGGGLSRGTTTVLTGPTGTGKSTLACTIARHAAAHDLPGVILSFEETADKMRARCRGMSLDLDALIRDGRLRLDHVDPVLLYPDELLARVREEVEVHGRRLVVLDSLRGYQIAMEEYGAPVAHLHNLVAYLERKGVTTFLVNEVERITGDVSATELGISHLADNVVMLRYAEHRGRVIKLVGCLKKRVGSFVPELRELRTTSAGIEIGEPLVGLRGLLTGAPTSEAV